LEKFGIVTAKSKTSPGELEKFESELKSEVRKTIKDVLKSFKISVGRFKELKSEYEELVQQYISEHMSEYTVNQLGFMAMD